MALAREIRGLYGTMSAEGVRLFGRDAQSLLEARPEFQSVEATMPSGAGPSLTSALQALAVLEQDLQPKMVEAEFVATLPSTTTTAARPTADVAMEMLGGAKREIIAVGYEIDDAGFVDALRTAARRVPVTLILDRERSRGAKLLGEWPTGLRRPTVFQDREREGAAPYAKMHGKALLVDGQDLLVSSANFTFHGLHGNVEFGIRLRGPVAGRAADVFRALVQSGLLERLS